MKWLNDIVDNIIVRHPDGEILIESGSSPSGSYHLGHLRELVICDAILLELRRRGREARHIQFVDDLDAVRKIPVNVPAEYEQYMGFPLCDVPSPDDATKSYGDYFLQGLIDACEVLGVEVEYVKASERYRAGWYVPAIEKALENLTAAKHALETVSGRELDEHWSPIQVKEGPRLKKRAFASIDQGNKTLVYKDADGNDQTIAYNQGDVKLDWRLDWPGRWWLQDVQVEPSGRDHMTKGGSYDTGVQIMHEVYGGEPPLAVAYDFINMAGDTKKMSASKGTGLDAVEGAKIMPPEVVRYFILSAPPAKRLYFDAEKGIVKLIDEFAAFAAKPDKTESEQQLWFICTRGSNERSVSQVPFSHLVASYQAALKQADKALELISRTEYAETAADEADIIRQEFKFIDDWLSLRAPDDVKFELVETVDPKAFSPAQSNFLNALAEKIEAAPADADGEWFHKTIYDFKDKTGLEPKELFSTLYQSLIGKDSGPRAGWFLSILPKDWLVRRLRLES